MLAVRVVARTTRMLMLEGPRLFPDPSCFVDGSEQWPRVDAGGSRPPRPLQCLLGLGLLRCHGAYDLFFQGRRRYVTALNVCDPSVWPHQHIHRNATTASRSPHTVGKRRLRV
jgi:hypothetical protein